MNDLHPNIDTNNQGHRWFAKVSLAASLMVLTLAQTNPSAIGQATHQREATGSAAPIQNRSLVPGEVIKQEIGGREVHSYQLTLNAGEFLRVVVDQRGADVVVTLIGPDDKKLISVDLLWALGPESISYVATEGGVYRLEVRALLPQRTRGLYQLTSVVKPAATASDKTRWQAETLLMEAHAFEQKGTTESWREAVARYEQALPLWRELGDQYWEAYSLAGLGRSSSDRKILEQSVALRKSIHDASGIADSLLSLSLVHGMLGQKQEELRLLDESLTFIKQTGSSIYEGYKLQDLGRHCLYDLKESQKALEFLDQALAIEKSINDPDGETTTLYMIASAHYMLGKKQEALNLYLDVLERHKAGYQQVNQPLSLFQIANIYRELHEPRKAIDYGSQALALHQTDKHRADTLQLIAICYSEVGENENALEHFKLALELRRSLGASPGQVDMLYSLGVIYYSLGEPTKALEMASEGLEISRTLNEKPRVARGLYILGDILIQKGELQKGRESLEQSVSLFHVINDRKGEALSLRDLATHFWDAGQFPKCLVLLNQSLAISNSIDDREAQALTLRRLSFFYIYLGDKVKGKEAYAQSLVLQKDIPNFNRKAAALRFVGEAAVYNEELPKALESLNQTLQMVRTAKNRPAEAGLLGDIGITYGLLGDHEKALDNFGQSLRIYQALGFPQGELAALGNFGWIYLQLKNYPKAFEYLNASLALARRMSSLEDEAITFQSIGWANYKLGNHQRALEYLKKALAIHQMNGSRRSEAAALTNIGSAYAKMNRPKEALEFHRQALAIFRQVDSQYGEGETLSNLMELWTAQGKPQLAILHGKQAVNLFQQTRRKIGELDAGLQASYLKKREETYRQLADLLISEGRLPEAQQVLGLLKEEEYFEFVRRDSTALSLLKRSDLTPNERAAIERYDKIADSITERAEKFEALQTEKKSSDETRYRELRSQLEDANQAFKVFLRQLEDEFGKRSAAVSDVRPGLRSDLEKIGKHIVVVHTLVTPKNYRAILTTSNLQVARESNPKVKSTDLNKLILDFRETIQNPNIDPRPLGQKLYRILVGPIAKDLEAADVRTVVWSLDGTLRYLPVSALYDGRQYLAERYQNVIITTASLPRLNVEPATETLGLGVGVSKQMARPWGNFTPLPFVPDELHDIIREDNNDRQNRGLVSGRIMLDEAFTAKALEEALAERRYTLVHIASHFSFKPGNDTESFLLLGDGERLTLDKIFSTASGKFFYRVDLLTLSACNTAIGGEANGREVDGFAVLAQNQGAEAVLATLWPVADESTRLFMQSFYQYRVKGHLTKAESLQKAQMFLLHGRNSAEVPVAKNGENLVGGPRLVTLKRPFVAEAAAPFAHPYFWSPFILLGNWR